MEIQEFVMEVSRENHDDFLGSEFAVLNFFPDWHMDCLMVMLILESLAEELVGQVRFGKVDIEECEELAEKYGIVKVPCVVIFKNGQIVERIEKGDSEEFLRGKILGFDLSGKIKQEKIIKHLRNLML